MVKIQNILIFLFLISFSFGQNINEEINQSINSDKILKRDGILYHIDEYLSSSNPKPFTGEVYLVGKNTTLRSDNGKFIVSEYSVKNGLKHGNYTRWDERGQRLDKKGEYYSGKKNGLWYEISYNGKHQLIFYKNGKKNGLYRRYHNSSELSELEEIGQFINDEKEGVWIEDISYKRYIIRLYKNGVNKNISRKEIDEIKKTSDEYKKLLKELDIPFEIKNLWKKPKNIITKPVN